MISPYAMLRCGTHRVKAEKGGVHRKGPCISSIVDLDLIAVN